MSNTLITGSNSKFCKLLKEKYYGKNIIYTSKKQFNILNPSSMEKTIRKIKPKILIHIAGLSRPMKIHEKDIKNSEIYKYLSNFSYELVWSGVFSHIFKSKS